MRKREAMEARILAMRKEFEAEEDEAEREASQALEREQTIIDGRDAMALSRQADKATIHPEKYHGSRHEKISKSRRKAGASQP
jgi:uncharacterized protein (DUF2252 family)